MLFVLLSESDYAPLSQPASKSVLKNEKCYRCAGSCLQFFCALAFYGAPKKFITIFFPFNARACMFVSNIFLCYYQSQGNDPVNKQLYGCFSTFCFQRLTKCSLVLLFLLSLFHLMSEINIVSKSVAPRVWCSVLFFCEVNLRYYGNRQRQHHLIYIIQGLFSFTRVSTSTNNLKEEYRVKGTTQKRTENSKHSEL